MVEKTVVEGIELRLSEPAEINMDWVGDDTLIKQLTAAWLKVVEEDLPLNPRILGKPGVGKTTLAYAAGKSLKRPVYLFQASMDVRPEDLIITPVIASKSEIEYHASSLVTAMIKGGVCVLDEGNRMSEKCWATLAPLMDRRRYVESIIAGIRIYAHEDFRFCVTMNEDSSTYEIPEYISSRLNPKLFVEHPSKVDELKILKYNIPFTDDGILEYVVDFLANSHNQNEPYTSRDGINILRYYIKTREQRGQDFNEISIPDFKDVITHILDEAAIKFTREEYKKYLEERNSDVSHSWDDDSDDDDDIKTPYSDDDY